MVGVITRPSSVCPIVVPFAVMRRVPCSLFGISRRRPGSGVPFGRPGHASIARAAGFSHSVSPGLRGSCAPLLGAQRRFVVHWHFIRIAFRQLAIAVALLRIVIGPRVVALRIDRGWTNGFQQLSWCDVTLFRLTLIGTGTGGWAGCSPPPLPCVLHSFACAGGWGGPQLDVALGVAMFAIRISRGGVYPRVLVVDVFEPGLHPLAVVIVFLGSVRYDSFVSLSRRLRVG